MNSALNFIAIDFETATAKRSSICEVGICVVRDGQVVETRSWLVQPEDNVYHYWNTKVHGIRPEDTCTAPYFPEVWAEIERTYLGEYNTFVAHNASFDRSCLEHVARLYGIALRPLNWDCSLSIARQLYNFGSNSLAFLCDQLAIERGAHHRAGNDAEMCARLYLRQQRDLKEGIGEKTINQQRT
ncbi:MAG: 3'-5' exonuclease [Porphyromonas sp.]|nr:3'-5' exonuclease [Porphyromonas sp.]